MRFLTLYKPGADGGPPPNEREMADMGRLIEEMTKAGILIDAETKELVGGYAILEAKSKAEAIELTKRFLSVVRGGESEVREMWSMPAS